MFTETIKDTTGTYEQRWATAEVPEPGVPYRVLKDEWSDDFNVRTILAWVAGDED